MSDSPDGASDLPDFAELAADPRIEPQADEPHNRANQRQPDMLLTAEAGWLGAELVHGPDKKAQLRKAIDEHRAEEWLRPVEWEE